MRKFLKFMYKLFWFLIIGLVSGVLCIGFGAGLCATLVLIPFGIRYFKALPLMVVPSGKRVIMNFKKTGMTTFLNIVYLIFGGFIFPLFYGFLIFVLYISIIGIPFAKELGNVSQILIAPFGAEVVGYGEVSSEIRDIDDILLINNRVVYYTLKDKEHLKSVLRARKDELKKAYERYLEEKGDTLDRITKGTDLTVAQFQNYYYHPKKGKFIKGLSSFVTLAILGLMIFIYFKPEIFKIFEWLMDFIDIDEFQAFPYIVFMIFGASCIGFTLKRASKYSPEVVADQQITALYKIFKYGEKKSKDFYKLLKDILKEAYGNDFTAEFDYKGSKKKVVIGNYHYLVLDDTKCIYGLNNDLLDRYSFTPIHNVVVYEGKNEVLNFAWDSIINEVINEVATKETVVDTIVEGTSHGDEELTVAKDNRVNIDTERVIDTTGSGQSSTEFDAHHNKYHHKSTNFNNFNKNDSKK